MNIRKRSIGIAGITAKIDMKAAVIVENIATRAVMIGADIGMVIVAIASIAVAIVATVMDIGTHWQSLVSNRLSSALRWWKAALGAAFLYRALNAQRLSAGEKSNRGMS